VKDIDCAQLTVSLMQMKASTFFIMVPYSRMHFVFLTGIPQLEIEPSNCGEILYRTYVHTTCVWVSKVSQYPDKCTSNDVFKNASTLPQV
jgi:hypothetical protein